MFVETNVNRESKENLKFFKSLKQFVELLYILAW